MSRGLFVFGTLRHLPLLDTVVDGLDGLNLRPALAPGFQAHSVQGAAYPVLREGGAGAAQFAEGLLIEDLDPVQRARLDFFEAGFGYHLRDIPVTLEKGARGTAQVYWPDVPTDVAEKTWSLSAFSERYGEIWVEAAREAMGYFGKKSAHEVALMMPTIQMRAASRLRAQEALPTSLRSGLSARDDVHVLEARTPYVNYFQIGEQDLSFRQFDGEMSAAVTRAALVGGDAVTVLPYDPQRDVVLLIEQFRMGPFLRGDPKPWLLEPIAGRIDPGETPQACARREAFEEAGVTVGALENVGQGYPSPGAMSEFLYSYVAVMELAGLGGEVHGLKNEAEDIRTHVIGFDRLMELARGGEVASVPLLMSAYWLALNRERLRASA
ncbi:MAG: NUDIX domain-containing protein [Maritimibacter sp.]